MSTGGSGKGWAQDASLQAIIALLGGGGTTAAWVDRGPTTLNSLVVSVGAKTLLEFQVTNENPTGGPSRWLMLFDANAVPANGATPKLMPWLIAPGEFLAVFSIGYAATVGITLAVSTTNTTLTVSTDAPGTASITARAE